MKIEGSSKIEHHNYTSTIININYHDSTVEISGGQKKINSLTTPTSIFMRFLGTRILKGMRVMSNFAIAILGYSWDTDGNP